MTYELAKKLKEAGFPQGGSGLWYTTATQVSRLHEIEPGDVIEMEVKPVYSPSLSELIEACGDRFSYLKKVGDQWDTSADNEGWGVYGSTPEGAMAKLWLALNE